MHQGQIPRGRTWVHPLRLYPARRRQDLFNRDRQEGTSEVFAITVKEPGGTEMISWEEVPDPAPGPGELLIDVVASGVNRGDLLQRAGFYDPPPGSVPYLGLECSGRVAATGPGVTGWSRGDEVCALLTGGGQAQQVVVPAGQALPVPRAVGLVEAAALPEVACTVWVNLIRHAGLEAGETVLIHGGGGGIGTFAIQFAKAIGARVLTTARAAKHPALRRLGADLIVDHSDPDQDFVTAVMAATEGRGADVILDILGAGYLARNIAALAVEGRLVVIGLQRGRKAELDLNSLLQKRASVTATALRGRTPAEKAEIIQSVRNDVWPLIEAGAIRPIVHQLLPMADAARAHQILSSSEHIGKVLLVNSVLAAAA
jgi:putative PIG3 family NAD(P)H quinone oxidoreductase